MIWLRYQFGMRQSATRVNLAFSLPAHLSLENLDTWIKLALEAEPESYQPILVNGPSAFKAEEAYLARLLQVSSILLQDIRVPVFERAAIVNINPHPGQPDHYMADIWLPVVDGFPINLFHTWLILAHDLITSVSACANDPTQLENLYQNFQQKHVLPWSRQIAGAKSTIPILQAAFELGIPMVHCGSGRYLLGWGRQGRFFERSSNGQDSAIGAIATHNKDVALGIMRFAGIPVPKGIEIQSGQAIRLADLSQLKIPLVVKPVDKDRGEGVTLGVDTEESLQQAVAKVAALSRSVLIEEQIAGTCHRILVVNDQIIYVVKRNPKGVVGDGVSTIEALVNQINATINQKIPQKRLPELKLDDEATRCLAEAGLNRTSVPQSGQRIALRPAQSTVWGGDPEEVTEQIHPDNANIAIRAARLFGLACAGVDFISSNISVPWHQNGAAINEINYAPVMGRTHPYQRQAARAYLAQLFPTRGKIPIQVFTGEANQQAAQSRWQKLITTGQQCYLCAQTGVLNPKGQPMVLAGNQNLQNHIAMLRANVDVEAIVVHTLDTELFEKEGWPFEDAIYPQPE